MTARPSASRRRRSILVVEDHEETRALYAEHFARAGYRVEEAADGNEAVAAVLARHPDVVLLDLTLPRLDGWDTVALLRSYETSARVPVVAVTAIASDAGVERARILGCNAVVRKPCTALDIERIVDDVLDDDRPESDSA